MATRGSQGKKRTPTGLTYAGAGVDIDAGDEFARSIRGFMRRTHGPRVLARPGGFAGLLRLDYNEALFKHNFADPVLVACCDGVGTKIKLALDAARLMPERAPDIWRGIGQDLVAMNVNDLVVEGAEPLLFLDYIACNAVDKAVLGPLVEGVAAACKACGCALLGGETAEMSDMYQPGDLDLAGFSVGVVELKRATDRTRVEPGDVVLGLESDGVHSNGFTLVRKVVEAAGLDLAGSAPHATGLSLAESLLTPTRLYAPSIVALQRAYRVKKVVTGMAHITGGGLADNLGRALHDGVDADISLPAAIKKTAAGRTFEALRKAGGIDPAEMARVFNMGIGYCLIVRPAFERSIAQRLERLGERVHRLGVIKEGSGRVRVKRAGQSSARGR